MGTNTQEAERAVESNYMEPCQPGTSVNLEGIVWHETEEGKDKYLSYWFTENCSIVTLKVLHNKQLILLP